MTLMTFVTPANAPAALLVSAQMRPSNRPRDEQNDHRGEQVKEGVVW